LIWKTKTRQFLLVAETRYAVEVCADRLHGDLVAADMSTDEIHLIERSGVKHDEQNIAKASGDALLGSPDNPADKKPYQLSIVAHERVIQSLQNRLDSHPFSLTEQLLNCLDVLAC